jgi:hypothetical protein
MESSLENKENLPSNFKKKSVGKLINPSQVSKYNKSYCWQEDNGLGRYLGKFRNTTIDALNQTLYHFDYHTIKDNIFMDGKDTKTELNLRRILDEACIPSPEEFRQMSLEKIKEFIPDTKKIPLNVYVERIGAIHNELKQQIKNAEYKLTLLPLHSFGGKTYKQKKNKRKIQKQSKRNRKLH